MPRSDIYAGAIFLKAGHTGWAAITFSIVSLSSVLGGYFGCLAANEMVRHTTYKDSGIVLGCLGGMVGLQPLVMACQVVCHSDSAVAGDNDKEATKLMVLKLLEGTIEAIPQTLLQVCVRFSPIKHLTDCCRFTLRSPRSCLAHQMIIPALTGGC